jgi:hypothetical protein
MLRYTLLGLGAGGVACCWTDDESLEQGSRSIVPSRIAGMSGGQGESIEKINKQ